MKRAPTFHEGELAVQRRAKEAESAAHRIGLVRDTLAGGAIPFIRKQSMLTAGSVDESGRVWASMLFGEPGFVDPSPDAQSLTVHLDRTVEQISDPLLANLDGHPGIGLLLIDLSSRQRLRVNGVARRSGNILSISVRETFQLCPKYIQKRQIRLLGPGADAPVSQLRDGHVLGPEQIASIAAADTFFVASTHRTRGPDVSHRGGNPGFVEVLSPNSLRVPDYPGNSLFNTLGNLSLNPSAGLVFPDFVGARILQLTGSATILWDQADPGGQSGGTHRFWNFHLEYWRETELNIAIRAELLEYSPFNP